MSFKMRTNCWSISINYSPAIKQVIRWLHNWEVEILDDFFRPQVAISHTKAQLRQTRKKVAARWSMASQQAQFSSCYSTLFGLKKRFGTASLKVTFLDVMKRQFNLLLTNHWARIIYRVINWQLMVDTELKIFLWYVERLVKCGEINSWYLTQNLRYFCDMSKDRSSVKKSCKAEFVRK